MPHSNYTVATASQLEGFRDDQFHEEKYTLKNLQMRTEETHLDKAKPEILPALRYGEERNRDNISSTEIYFAPQSVSSFLAELSDPLQEPQTAGSDGGNCAEVSPVGIMPTNARGSEARDRSPPASAILRPDSKSLRSDGGKLTLRATDLDRLVFALANASMIRRHIQAEATPPSQRKTPAYPLVISDAHERILESSCCDSAVELAFPRGLASPPPPITPVRDVTDIAPIRSTFVRVHMTLSTTKQADCCLKIRTDAAKRGKPHVRISMELNTDLLVRKTGQRIYNMFTEIDVTESFRSAAFAELIKHAGCASEDVVWEAGESDESSGVTDNTMSDECNAQTINTAAGIISDLKPETCTMDSLTLMSELARIKRKYRNCAIVLHHSYHANGIPASSSMPWVSEHFDEITKRRSRDSSINEVNRFEVAMMKCTAVGSTTPTAFTRKAWIAGEKRSVFFVPLYRKPSETVAGWVCFERNICDVGL